METFGFIADCASIVSLLISIFVASKVVKISANITATDSSETKVSQRIKGDRNIQTGIKQ